MELRIHISNRCIDQFIGVRCSHLLREDLARCVDRDSHRLIADILDGRRLSACDLILCNCQATLHRGRNVRLGLLGGTAQWRAARNGTAIDDGDEALHLDGLHRYVRHPLYAATFPILWGLVDSEFALATAIWASAYFWLGSRYEERRLIARYGEAYRRYRTQVPAFVPWRGRAI